MLITFFKVCQKFADVAKYDLEKRLIPLRKNDWRLEYIQKKKYGIEVSPFIVSNVLEKAKQKYMAFAERHILTKKRYDMDTDYDIQMTEVYLAKSRVQKGTVITRYKGHFFIKYVPYKGHFSGMKIFNRYKGQHKYFPSKLFNWISSDFKFTDL